MRRDFGLHYTAWFLVATPFMLIAGVHLKANGQLFGPEVSGAAVFVYGFLSILFISFVGAVIDVFIVGAIVAAIRRHFRIKHQRL